MVMMWECDFKKIVIKNLVEHDDVTKKIPLVARESFFEGRTNASQLDKCLPGEKITYDVMFAVPIRK